MKKKKKTKENNNDNTNTQYFNESKFLQHSKHMKHNSTAPDALVEVMKNHIVLQDADILRVLLVGFASITWRTALEFMALGIPEHI